VALGSNLGDRRQHLLWAAARLEEVLSGLRLSPIIETDAQDVPDVQPPYMNAVAVGQCELTPRQLLERLQQIERDRNRTRPGWRAARTLDLDLILYGDLVVDEADLTLPHPRFRERRFVLEPLVQLAAELRDPVTGKTAGELLAGLKNVGGPKGRPYEAP
jgi:2-amino-4-hydroxy-6-hydroxymethyldihydropteridine diphosphokinase